jgi:hypothetical protein
VDLRAQRSRAERVSFEGVAVGAKVEGGVFLTGHEITFRDCDNAVEPDDDAGAHITKLVIE